MDLVLKEIKERRSIRKYKNQMPSKEMINTLLLAGNWAPSDGNSQPWEFVVTTSDYVKRTCEVFYENAKKHIPNAPYIPEEKKPGMLEYAKNFGGALVHIIVTQPILEDKFKSDDALKACSAAVQNILLQAHSMNLGAVWICLPDNDFDKVAKIINLDKSRCINSIIPIGYPDMNPAAPDRVDPDMSKKATWLGF